MSADLAWLNLLLVPVVGLLMKISGQLSHQAATLTQHETRITTLERSNA